MKSLVVLIALIVCLAFTGCAPVLVGGLIYKSTKSKQEKNAFLQAFNQTNTEREKAGLSLLNRCVEMYYFDQSWARSFGECEHIIDSLDFINRVSSTTSTRQGLPRWQEDDKEN